MDKFSLVLLLALGAVCTEAKSNKRGIAYNLPTAEDIGAISSGVSWWYNWVQKKNKGIPEDYYNKYGMEYIPMLWDNLFLEDEAVNNINELGVKYFMVLNEPNLVEQANMSPSQAASIWPRYERVASRTGAKIVGPQITWGSMPGFTDPIVWLDNWIASYK